ncbi:hypothetical protein B0H10DRAFT_1966572 [Mycena sp. CBHHK59/15]|nr:hypothetical protein B0H10DRAFT_1966572 [Mycena sp. CBHHK59/15]
MATLNVRMQGVTVKWGDMKHTSSVVKEPWGPPLTVRAKRLEGQRGKRERTKSEDKTVTGETVEVRTRERSRGRAVERVSWWQEEKFLGRQAGANKILGGFIAV